MTRAAENDAMAPVSLILVSHSYPPKLGGSEIEAQRVCAALIRRGHRVMVLCAGGPPMPDAARWIDPSGVPVRIFARRREGRWQDYTYALAVAWTLFRERRNYQLTYFLMQGLHLATGLPVCRALGKPSVMKVSGSGLIPIMRQSWIGRLELRWLERWASRVMILNDGMVAEATDAGISKERLMWMPNPVDTAEFIPCPAPDRVALRARLGLPADARCIIFVGRLAPEKELPSLLRALPSVIRREPRTILVIVGDGPVRSELEALTRALEIGPHVRMTGRQTVPEVLEWLQASDVFALVSRNEGFPCSLVEAMAVCLPSVVSDIPANRQLIGPAVHGLHAVMGDSVSIGDALSTLLADDDLRRRLGAAARTRVVENYSVDRVVNRYEALFAEVLQSRAQ